MWAEITGGRGKSAWRVHELSSLFVPTEWGGGGGGRDSLGSQTLGGKGRGSSAVSL